MRWQKSEEVTWSSRFYCLKPYIFGASVSVFPHCPHHHHKPSVGVQLRTADGTSMSDPFSLHVSQLYCVYQVRSYQGLLSSANDQRGHSNDGSDYSFWSLWVDQDVVWFENDGPDSQWNSPLFCVCWWHDQSHTSTHVHQVLNRLRLLSLSINPAKCEFSKQEVEYLGMRVPSKRCFPLQKQSDVISAFPHPEVKKGLQRFLGILNFYRRSIKGTTGILARLTEALKGKVSTFSLTLGMNPAFSAAMSVLSNVPTLVQPDTYTKVSLSVNTSGSHIRAVL